MTNDDLIQKLLVLGFNVNEAKIYLVLLESGLETAGFLIKKTAFHRNVVYTALDKLIKRKLVVEFEQKGVKHYKATDPARILQEASELRERAAEVLPDLEKLKNDRGAEVAIYENREGFQSAHKQALLDAPENQTVYVMGARASFYEYMGESYKQLDSFRKKKNIGLKVIGFASSKNELQTERPLMETRYINESFISPVGTAVYGDSVLIQVYAEPTIVIRIKSPDVAKSYVEYFDLLWNSVAK